jgi:4-hydroxybenzoate polyprenyltransferase
VESTETDRMGRCVTEPPLVVDLDAALWLTDPLMESVLRLVKQEFRPALLLPFWLLRGRAYVRRRVSERVSLEGSSLPVNESLLEWLRGQKGGRRLVLAASDPRHAKSAAGGMRLFDDVIAGEFSGGEKAAAIVERCGGEFDYAGSSAGDLAVWQSCRKAILVRASHAVEAQVRRVADVAMVFPAPKGRWRAAVRSLRLYQWIKNLLAFVPALTSHTIFQPNAFTGSLRAFFAFSFCASGVYVLNDLLDLEEDRRHSRKRERPFASGECPISTGLFLAAICLAGGLAVAGAARDGLLTLMAVYTAVALLYSLRLKRALLLDVLTLSILYMLRIIGGHVVTGIVLTPWLLSFAFFLFLSLAFSKRVGELVKIRQSGGAEAPGRGYAVTDLPVITTAGVSSGFLSSMVLALYINSESVQLLYVRPEILWAILPPLLYYITRLWVICGRGELDDDPIVYTARDPATYYVAVVVALVMLAATMGWPLR